MKRTSVAVATRGAQNAEQRWRGQVEAWRASGLPMTEFATANGVKVATLRWWSSRLGRRAGSTQVSSPPQFVQLVRRAEALPLAGSAAPSNVIVEIGAVRIRVESGFDAGLLAEVVRALTGQLR